MAYRTRRSLAAVAFGAAAFALAACSDSTVEPTAKSATTLQPDQAHYTIATTSVTPGSYVAWCSLAYGCVDEGKTDPDMKTYQDPTHGIIYRRLKHFSGYNVVFGVDGCDPIDLSCSYIRDESSDEASDPTPATTI